VSQEGTIKNRTGDKKYEVFFRFYAQGLIVCGNMEELKNGLFL